MGIIDAICTYHVEIRHTGSQEWNHIHHPDWETSASYADTLAYAQRVRANHPTSLVRVVEELDGHPDHYIPVD